MEIIEKVGIHTSALSANHIHGTDVYPKNKKRIFDHPTIKITAAWVVI